MRKIYFLLMMVMVAFNVLGQTNNYFGTSGTLNGSVWSTNPAGPYTSALNTTGGAIINFQNITTTITGASITVAGINATANAAITTTGGTISNLSNGVIPVDVSTGVTLDFSSQAITTSGTAGYIKNSDGVWATGGGTYGGGFTLNAGTLVARGVNAMGGNATPGGLTINGGVIAGSANRDFSSKYSGITVGGDFTLGSSVAPAVGTSNLTFSNNVSLGNSTTRTITIGGTGLYTFSGIISGTSSNLNIGSTAAGTILLSGANTYSGTTTVNGGTLRLNRTGGTTIPITNNVVINGGTFQVSTNQALNNLTLASGATLTVDAGAILTINGTFNHNGGTITGTGTINYGALGTLSYGGTTTQTATSAEYPAVNVPNTVVINNAAGVNLHANRTLLNLTFASGHLLLGSNSLTVSILGSISGANSSRFVVTNGTGSLVMNGVDNNNFTFPVGPSTSLYHPATLNNSGTPDDFSVRVSSATPVCAPAAASVNAVWDISEAVPLGSNCAITLDYTGATTGGTFSTVGAQIIHCGGANYHSGSVTGTVASGTGFTEFSPFGITNDPVALPVKFGNVKAYQQGSGIKVDWSNLTESGVVNYTVERSANGQLFTPLGTVSPTANNSSRADYSYFDAAPLAGTGFYRIQSLEVDGKKLFSTIVRVSTKGGQADITIYPNPVSGNRVSFQATALPKGQYTVRVMNAAGQQVMSRSLLHNGGAVTEVLELPATIKTGMYNIQLAGTDIKLTKTFIIR